VIGFQVCGSNANANKVKSSPGYCSGIGGTSDNIRLLRCIASSTDSTNDHYLEVANPADLQAAFQIVAYRIAAHGLAVGN
jgi:hypothetical protein